MNYPITRFTRNLSFDEKIGGTMHLAIGQSVSDTGGRFCYERGKFTI